MLGDVEAAILGDLDLPLLDFSVIKLLDLAALHADQVIVVLAFVQFENRLARFKVVTFKQASLLELGQNAIDSGEANVDILVHEVAVDVFSRHVALAGGAVSFLEQVQNFESGRGGLEADVLEFL